MEDLEPAVATGFAAAVARIEAAGHKVSRASLASLEAMKSLAVWQFSAVECRGEYEDAYQSQRDLFDPRVASRMARAEETSAVGYRQTLNQRAALIEALLTDRAEARKAKDPAILATHTGVVSFGKEIKTKIRLVITDEEGTEHEMLIPKISRINVFDGEHLEKGDEVVDGQPIASDILDLLGVEPLANFIVNAFPIPLLAPVIHTFFDMILI